MQLATSVILSGWRLSVAIQSLPNTGVHMTYQVIARGKLPWTLTRGLSSEISARVWYADVQGVPLSEVYVVPEYGTFRPSGWSVPIGPTECS